MSTVDAVWHRASPGTSGHCVEVAYDGEFYYVRDSRDPLEVLAFNSTEWDAFVTGVKAGEFRFR